MKTQILLSLSGILLLGGCSTRREFTGIPMYHEPIAHPARTPMPANVAVAEFSDGRVSRELDPVFADKPENEIERVLREELARSGLFTNASEGVGCAVCAPAPLWTCSR